MKKVQLTGVATIALVVIFFPFHKTSNACSISGKVNVASTCSHAGYIVRAIAVKYNEEPKDKNLWTNGIPDSKVEFEIEETLKGDSIPETLLLNGYLSDKDDFNDRPVPYDFVRPGGRGGSCFANTYKQGAQYLLLLKKSSEVKWPGVTTTFTVNISALAPVNEQLHSESDPWIFYIKGLLAGLDQVNKVKK